MNRSVGRRYVDLSLFERSWILRFCSLGLKLVYSKQHILGLTQEFCWAYTYGGGSETSYRDEVRERKVIVN